MEPALALRLDAYSRLSKEERTALAAASKGERDAPARHDIVREGEPSGAVRLIISGWACRYKTTPDGQRQIVGLFVPGDFCDVNVHLLRQMDHSIAAITKVKYTEIAPEQMEALTGEYPRILQALWRHQLVGGSIQREWLLNIGARSAYERLGHLFLEMFFRMRAVGLVQDSSCDFPLTQTDLGDATGLTTVHTNRMLQELRSDGLVELNFKRLRIPDLNALMVATQFNPNYLHLEQRADI